jgi:hypothetical protein
MERLSGGAFTRDGLQFTMILRSLNGSSFQTAFRSFVSPTQ